MAIAIYLPIWFNASWLDTSKILKDQFEGVQKLALKICNGLQVTAHC